jgi:hypothetical protein
LRRNCTPHGFLGLSSLEAIVTAAKTRGSTYVTITAHVPREAGEAIKRLAAEWGVNVSACAAVLLAEALRASVEHEHGALLEAVVQRTIRQCLWGHVERLGDLAALGQIADGHYLWQAGKGVVDIGTLRPHPGVPSGSTIHAINDLGQVVGESGDEGEVDAFIWDASTGIRALPSLFTAFMRDDCAFGINNKSQVVGRSAQEGPLFPHAVLWQPAANSTPPTTSAALAPPPNTAGWERSNVTVTLAATPASGGLPVQRITYSATGAQPIASTSVQGSTATLTILAEGTTTLSYFATDQAGNQEEAKTLTVRIDKTPPTMTCQASPSTLWPPNGKLMPVQVNVSVTDPNGSGPKGYELVSITSNEGDMATQQQGLVVGTASTSGSLQASRAGNGSGRVYTLTYQGSDLAGNTAACTTTVTVPKDQRH